MANLNDIEQQLAFLRSGGGRQPEFDETALITKSVADALNPIIQAIIKQPEVQAKFNKEQAEAEKTKAETRSIKLSQTPIEQLSRSPNPAELRSIAEKNLFLRGATFNPEEKDRLEYLKQHLPQSLQAKREYDSLRQKELQQISPQEEEILKKQEEERNRIMTEQGLTEQEMKLTPDQLKTLRASQYSAAGVPLREAQTQKALRPPTIPFKEQDIIITDEISQLSGGLLKPKETRKGFEVEEAFKQKRLADVSRMRKSQLEFNRDIRTMPPQNLIDDIANIDTSVAQLDKLELMARKSIEQGTLPIGRVQGYLTEAKQFLGQLTEEEARMRTTLKNQNAMTLRNLGGTALTKTEKETFEEALPLLTVSPTEFFSRLDEIRDSLYTKKDSIKSVSEEFGRPIGGEKKQADRSGQPKTQNAQDYLNSLGIK